MVDISEGDTIVVTELVEPGVKFDSLNNEGKTVGDDSFGWVNEEMELVVKSIENEKLVVEDVDGDRSEIAYIEDEDTVELGYKPTTQLHRVIRVRKTDSAGQ